MEVNISNLHHFSAFYGNFAIYTTTDKKDGLIDRQGQIVYRAGEFDIATHVEGTTFLFQNVDGSGKEMLFDAASREKQSREQPQVERKPMEKEYLVAPNRIAFQKNDLFGIKDEQGNIIVKPQYSQVSSLGENIGLVRVKDKNNKCGIIYAEDGRQFIPCKYKYIIHKRQTDTYKVVTLKGKCGLLDYTAKPIIPSRYDALDVTDNVNEIAVKRGGSCFFIDSAQQKLDFIEAWEYVDFKTI